MIVFHLASVQKRGVVTWSTMFGFYPKSDNISSRYGQQLIQMETPPVNHLTLVFFCGLPTNWYSHVGIPSISIKCGAYWSPTSWFLGLCLRGCRWGDGYTGLGQLFRCPVVSCGRGDGRQYQESVDFWWELSFKSWRPPIFRHKKLPSHLEPIWCRLYPFRETVTWFRRFDPIPQASRTREQRKCQCNSQTGWLGMGMWWLGDPRFYFSKISKP